MPASDPRKTFSDMPPVQSLEGANVQATLTGSADVRGEVTDKNEVTASSSLISIVQRGAGTCREAFRLAASKRRRIDGAIVAGCIGARCRRAVADG